MNKDEFDLYRHLKKDQGAFDLIRGLEDRSYGQVSRHSSSKESVEFYAEEQFIRKREFDEMRCEMPGLPRSTFLMVFSPDGSRVASTHGNHNIYISDVRSGKNIRTLVGHPRTPWCIAFHPTSNQIVASGCLGGQVRIWDLSVRGGSEVWTAENQTVIASLAFHPNDRLLAIATYNEVYFWDWSQPEPFVHAATSNPKEKVRYVAFDKLGHKLITGIANTPQTRWERVRAPVPIPRQERSSGPYRRRITQRLVSVDSGPSTDPRNIPERERRITTCYRNLVREYEQLVHRYLQLYRPPTMIDRGTDPMEPNPWFNNSGTQTSESSSQSRPPNEPPSNPVPSTSSMAVASSSSSTFSPQVPPDWSVAGPSSSSRTGTGSSASTDEPVPSTSRDDGDNTPSTSSSHPSPSTNTALIKPSRIFSVYTKPSTLMTSTQTLEDRKHKTDTSSCDQQPHSKKHKTTNHKLIKKSSKDKRTSSSDSDIPKKAVKKEAGESSHDQTSRNNDMGHQSGGDLNLCTCSLDPTTAPSTSKSTDENTGMNSKSDTNNTKNQKPSNEHQSSEASSCNNNNITTSTGDDTATSNQKSPTKIKKPVMVIKIKSTTIDTTSTPTITSTSGLRLRIPLDDNDSNVRATIEHSLLGNSTQMGATSSTTTTSRGSGSSGDAEQQQQQQQDANSDAQVQNNVDEILSNIRRNAEEEVRNRILPIIRSVPVNDRPELIRLFENSREHVRMRFRQMYPVFLRKPNRRFPNNPYLITDSSSSSSEDDRFNNSTTSNNSNINRLTSFSTDPSSTNPPRLNPRPDATNASTTVRNFNTELEELVTSLLTEIERTENRAASRRSDATSSNTNVATTNTGNNPSPLLVTVSSLFDGPSTSSLTPSSAQEPASATTTEHSRSSDPNNPPLAHLLFQECLQMLKSSREETSSNTTTISTAPTTSNTTFSNTFGTSGINNSTTSAVINNSSTNNNSTFTPEEPQQPSMTSSPPATGSILLSSSTPPTTIVNTSTGTTNSTIYTSNTIPRRRFFSHRISAFMPTRVNYTRSPPGGRLRRSTHVLGRGRLGLRNQQTSFALDELINFAERENSEEDQQNSRYSFSPLEPHTSDIPAMDNFNFNNVYSNILHEIELSLTDIIEIRSGSGPDRSERLLANFSNRLVNIENQSDSILRNLSHSMDMLNNATDSSRQRSQINEPSVNFFDPNFYIRDQRDGGNGVDNRSNETINVSDLFSNTVTLRAVSADHTYPRNPDDAQTSAGHSDSVNPLISSIQVTVSHIQRQARFLRQRVQVIERLNRTIDEITQLQMIRRMIVDLIGHLRSVSNTSNESRNTGMSSVRQMMAGTRISDASPPQQQNVDEPSSNNTNTSHLPGPSSSNETSNEANNTTTTTSSAHNRTRLSCRKTYPPSRLYRLARQCRRPSILHFFSRRYMNRSDRNPRHGASQSRTAAPSRPSSTSQDTNSSGSSSSSHTTSHRDPLFSPYSIFNNNNLSLMTRRFELLLTEQMRVFTSPQQTSNTNQTPRSNATTDLGEHILALRLHGCILRMNRVFRDSPLNTIGNFTSQPMSAVSQEGVSRYGARHTLSLLIDNASRHLEIGRHNISSNIRQQIHRVLAMAFLLTELMLLIVIDSVPPANNFDMPPSNEISTSRLCIQILRNRSNHHTHQLSRSLRLMRLTMRHAHHTFVHDYVARRAALAPCQNIDRLQLLGCINRCLRSCKPRTPPTTTNNQEASTSTRQQQSTNTTSDAQPSTSGNNSNNSPSGDWYNAALGLIDRYIEADEEAGAENDSTLSPNHSRQEQLLLPSGTPAGAAGELNNDLDNSDAGEDDEQPIITTSHNNNAQPQQQQPSSAGSSNLYRTNNMNLIQNNDATTTAAGNENGANNNNSGVGGAGSSSAGSGNGNQSRPWNVPSVQVNDVPVSEPSTLAQRMMTQRQRFAERVSELRSNPSGLFRPRFLHPLYATVNPFDADLDDIQRDQIYDSDIITTVTPNHRIQAWDISDWSIPMISNTMKNLVVGECKIHNDASVDVAKDGTILVTLLPSGGYLNVTNRLGVYSLRWETLGQCLYTTNFEQNAVSVSLSPLSRHLVVGLASRIVPSERWIMARVFKIDRKDMPGDRLPVLRELEQNRDSRLNCIRWLPNSGQGLIYATNTGQLVILS